GNGPRSITGLGRVVRAARWLDNGKDIQTLQDESGNLLTLNCDGYDYGVNLVVRVAELGLE
ncbi:MAG: hypothetical protein N2322_05795, partial [Terrimicrobiaceae bacterium]|nr:hypothetical protein [Terrimicrobiaceae bacterium]